RGAIGARPAARAACHAGPACARLELRLRLDLQALEVPVTKGLERLLAERIGDRPACGGQVLRLAPGIGENLRSVARDRFLRAPLHDAQILERALPTDRRAVGRRSQV